LLRVKSRKSTAKKRSRNPSAARGHCPESTPCPVVALGASAGELIPAKPTISSPVEKFSSHEHPIISRLENELKTTREDLQTTIEELETSNEELKSAHEELVSMNEGLQSANDELQRKIVETDGINNELRRAHQERAHLAAIIESSEDAIIGKTLNGTITSWNKAAEHLFGFSAAEMIGQPITRLFPEDRLEEEPVIIGRIAHGERVQHFETVRKCKDGRLIDLSLTISPIRDTTGRIIGASKIARDISQRKRIETALHKAKEELEQRVQERTASLLETTEQLETFCYTVAHDLRSPMRAQQSFAKVLLEDYREALGEEGRDYAKRILRSAERLDRLVQDLLTYSRMSRGEIKFARVNLAKTLADTQLTLSDDLFKTGTVLTAGDLHSVVGYEPTLNIILTNLLANAMKFVKAGTTPRVNIYSEQRDGTVRLWVEDNGIGIPAAARDKIFGVFHRLHPLEKYPGTGIGLAIVQKGVQRMGGKVGVESQPDQGSRFWIELPAAQASAHL
jgi:PAS domain S-box-containing protein